MSTITSGKGGEMIVGGKLLLEGLEVFIPIADVGIDLIVRKEREDGTVTFYEIQVKTMKSYGRMLNFKEKHWINAPDTRVLIIYYRHTNEFFYLTPEQVRIPERLIPNSKRGDFRFTAKDREQLKNQNLKGFVQSVKGIG